MGTASLSDSNICRLCGLESNSPSLIFDENDEEPFYLKINKYLPIQVYDDGRYPRRACSSCYLSVTSTQVFLDRILEGQLLIARLLQQSEPAAAAGSGSLYQAGNALQADLEAAGLTLQKRRRGRPRKSEARIKTEPGTGAVPAAAAPAAVIDSERPRRARGRPPARLLDSVRGRELERAVGEGGGAAAADDPEDDAGAADDPEDDAGAADDPEDDAGAADDPEDDAASCHIRVNVLSLPPSVGADADAAAGDTAGSQARPDAPAAAVRRRGRPRRPRVPRFKCEVCGKCFLHSGRLQFHRALHRGVRYECVECSSRFREPQQLDTHQETSGHTGRGVVEGVDEEPLLSTPRLRCDSCPRTFQNATTLSVHQSEVHNPDKQHACSVCGKRFGVPSNLQLHMRHHKTREPGKFICSQCHKIFNSRTALTYHNDTQHGDGRLFICNLCGKSFRNPHLLSRHSAVHSSTRKYSCPQCPSRFKTRSHLTTHLVTHTGERRFACAHCPKRFAHKTSLDTHQRWHIGDRPFSCAVCDKRFTQKSNLLEHQRVHSGEKPFSCSFCTKLFSTSSQLSAHLRRHGAGKPLVCRPCGGLQFECVQLWRAHRQLCHPGLPPPHKCTTCGRELTTRAALRRHMRTHAAAQSPGGSGQDRTAVRELAPGPAPPADPKVAGQVIYVTLQNPSDPSTVQFASDAAEEEGGGSVQLTADSEVLLQTAAAGVVQLAANRGLLTAEGTCSLELTADDGRRVQITLRDEKNELEPGPGVGPGGDAPPEEEAALLVTAPDGHHLRLTGCTAPPPG